MYISYLYSTEEVSSCNSFEDIKQTVPMCCTMDLLYRAGSGLLCHSELCLKGETLVLNLPVRWPPLFAVWCTAAAGWQAGWMTDYKLSG